jgi:hypothetical protein
MPKTNLNDPRLQRPFMASASSAPNSFTNSSQPCSNYQFESVFIIHGLPKLQFSIAQTSQESHNQQSLNSQPPHHQHPQSQIQITMAPQSTPSIIAAAPPQRPDTTSSSLTRALP